MDDGHDDDGDNGDLQQQRMVHKIITAATNKKEENNNNKIDKRKQHPPVGAPPYTPQHTHTYTCERRKQGEGLVNEDEKGEHGSMDLINVLHRFHTNFVSSSIYEFVFCPLSVSPFASFFLSYLSSTSPLFFPQNSLPLSLPFARRKQMESKLCIP